MASLTRREALKLVGLLAAGSLASLAASPFSGFYPPESDRTLPIGRGRVGGEYIYRYRYPSFRSQRLGVLRRDELVNIYFTLNSPHGPLVNPVWYLTQEGFVHSGYIQRVDQAREDNPLVEQIPESGVLGEITSPMTISQRWTRSDGWRPLYRLRFSSVFWVTGVDEGPDGSPWYRLTDDLLSIHYHVPHAHVRLIPPTELAPISPDVPPEAKRIQISIAEQTLTAYEGENIVLATKISSGLPTPVDFEGDLPTDTPTGRFRVQTKMPSRHMGDGKITADPDAYELPGVPWVCLFTKDGIGLHGTYWHDNFGRRMSHGCVNLRNRDALWLYRWTNPIAGLQDWYRRELGTLIEIN